MGDRNVKTFLAKSAEMCPSRLQDSSVTTFQGRSARMFQDNNVNKFLVNSVAMFLVNNVAMFQGSSVEMFHHRSVATFQDNSAAVFLASNASRSPSRSVTLLSHPMEGSKKVKEKKKIQICPCRQKRKLPALLF